MRGGADPVSWVSGNGSGGQGKSDTAVLSVSGGDGCFLCICLQKVASDSRSEGLYRIDIYAGVQSGDECRTMRSVDNDTEFYFVLRSGDLFQSVK